MPTSQTPGPADPVNSLRCVIVDDDPAFIQAASALLGGDGVTVAGTASNLDSAVRQVDALRPDVVLIDIRLGKESGFTVASKLGAGDHHPALIMISTYAEADYADLLAESPVVGFLPKTALSGPAIRQIIARST
jgi:DNA-binding NarL/FixJ family response regulator